MTDHKGVLSGRIHKLPDQSIYRSKRIRTNPVHIVVTSTIVKTQQNPRGAKVRAFSFNNSVNSMGRSEYWVPLYKMIVPGEAPFRVVRFGVWRNAAGNEMVVGKSTRDKPDHQRHVLRWQKKGSGRWKLSGYDKVLVHDGADNENQAWGALGCIEVFGDQEWARFNKVVRRMSGIADQRLSALEAALEKNYSQRGPLRDRIDRVHWDIGDAANLTLTLEPAPMPSKVPA